MIYIAKFFLFYVDVIINIGNKNYRYFYRIKNTNIKVTV